MNLDTLLKYNIEKNKGLFHFDYYKGIYMRIETIPNYQNFSTRILLNNNIDFGKMVTTRLPKYWFTAEELIEKYPKYKSYYEYFKFLEEIYPKLKLRHVNGKDIPREVWKYSDVCHHIGDYRRYGNRVEKDGWKIQVIGLPVQKWKQFKLKQT